jgi:hypothetical protein
MARDALLTGLRCHTGDLRVHADIVEGASNNRQGDRSYLDAAVGGSVEVMTLAGRYGTNDQPDDEYQRSNFHLLTSETHIPQG